MAEQTTDNQQTTILTPGPYAPGGEAIWQDFLNRYFGTPHISEAAWNGMETKPYGNATYEDYLQTPEHRGLLGLQQDQNQFESDQWNDLYNNTVKPAYDQFGEGLDYIAGSGGRYEDAMSPYIQGVTDAQAQSAANPLNIKFSGGNFNALRQGGINQAKDQYNMGKNIQDQRLLFNSTVLPNLNTQRLTGRITPAQANYEFAAAHNPALIESQYIQDQLTPLASGMQNLRYGLPMTSQSGNTTGTSTLGALGTIGQGLGLLGDLGISGSDIWEGIGGLGDYFSDAYQTLEGANWGSLFDSIINVG